MYSNFIILLLVTIIIGFARSQLEVIPIDKVDKGLLPWIGVLRVQPGDGLVALTGIVLIQNAVAIGNAFDISKISKTTIRDTTQALFYNELYMAWYCDVTDYVTHPEFEETTVNTLALVFLESEKTIFKWQPIEWAKKEKKKYHSVFHIGYTDRNQVLEQTSYKMAHVSQSECIQFYQKEGIDFKIIWPTYYRCHKYRHANNTCVIDAGAALATNYTGQWELLGVSIQGPGCSVPSRYIDVLPYAPWIRSKLTNTRRTGNITSPTMDSEYYEDHDTIYMAKINDSSMVIRPWPAKEKKERKKERNKIIIEKEIIHGCNSSDGVITYRDFNRFELPSPAIGIYVLSHIDTIFDKYNCIMMDVHNVNKSDSKFWFDKGFHQEDIGLFMKKIPIKSPRGDYPPRIVYVEDTWRKYEEYRTANLKFRFQVEGSSWFDVKFYGDPIKKIYLTWPTKQPPKPKLIT